MSRLVVPPEPTVPALRCRDTAPDDTAPDDTAPDDTAPDDTAPDDTASPSPGLGEAGVITVRVTGDLDAVSADGWVTILISALEDASATARTGRAASHPAVECDLGAVRFLSAAGVTALLEVGAYAAARGAPYSVVTASRPVLRVLALSGTRLAVGATPAAPGGIAAFR